MVVTDLLPVQILNPFVSSSQGGCTGFPCALGDLPVGAAATILVNGVVAQDAVGSIVNVAQAGSGSAAGGGAVVTATVAVTVQPLADVVLAKQATPTAVAGQGIGYTLTVRNNGPSTANDVVVIVRQQGNRGCAGLHGGRNRRQDGAIVGQRHLLGADLLQFVDQQVEQVELDRRTWRRAFSAPAAMSRS